ncbi:Reticulocyte-binding protein 2-like protein a [Fusarium oxysporum f. sp. cubense]|uniref:Reticulocyte-binding protein 2-like protein a n=1 Tax=Fusarium oxysporum f. sp. cubense TaxID=61366 RepID=A0A559L8U6_FUSOC|nr:Reticulocyte-binding protein 2-like protein a [Fusarium oxysporum f. sp. cubense]
MLKQRPSGPVRFKRQRPSSKRTTVETDVSSDTNEQNYSDDSGDWFDDEDEIQPSDSASASAAPENPSSSSTARDTDLPKRHKLKDMSQGWSNAGLGGHPLVQHQYTYQGAGQAPAQPQHPSYQPTEGYRPGGMYSPRSYPSYNVQYPMAPNMQGVGMSGNNMQPSAYPYQPANTTNYFQRQQPAPPIPTGYPPISMDYPPIPPPPTEKPRDDPEKIRLEAELAAFKAMEEKAKTAEKQKETEAQIRKEAEEGFYQRMEDMRLAQEDAKKEIDRARLEAEKAAKERMEMEIQAQEKRAEEHVRAMAEAERAAMERLRAEREAEEERSKKFNEFAVNLEKEVRLKVEMEKRAELAERDAKAKQSEDLERLAKLKMIQSMDEIVNLTKKRVLHDLVTDGESIGSKDRQGWLIETRNEADAERSVLRTEKGQLSIPRSSTQPRHATVSTVRSASSASVKLPGVSPTPSWKGKHPEVPDPWASGSESDDEVIPSRAGTKAQHPSEPARDSRRNMFERQQQQRADTSRIEDLVDQIADAVMERLMHSPYNEILMHRPPRGQYYRRHVRPRPDPFATAPNPFPSARQFGNEDALEEASDYPQGPPPCGPSRRFYKPPKPARLRGRSIRGTNPTPSLDLPPHGAPSSQDVPIPIGKRRSSPPGSPQPGPPPPLEEWLNSSAQFGSQTSYSEVDTVIQETSTVHGVTPDSSEVTWKHPEPWIEEVPETVATRHRFGEVDRSTLGTYLTDREHVQKPYKYVFQDAESLPARLSVGVGN